MSPTSRPSVPRTSGPDPEPTWETERLRLEPLRARHAAALFTVLADPELYAYIPQDPPADVVALAARFRALESRQSPSGAEHWLNWAVARRMDGAYLGRLEATVRASGEVHIAFLFGREHWRQGYATEACHQLVLGLFENPAIRRIMADVDIRNTASIRLLSRLGFTRGPSRPAAEAIKGAASEECTFFLDRV